MSDVLQPLVRLHNDVSFYSPDDTGWIIQAFSILAKCALAGSCFSALSNARFGG